MAKKTQKLFRYDGFGFPVRFLNVPMIRIRGAWTPDIDYESLRSEVFKSLADKRARLTGNEVRFIRHHLRMTQEQFGERLGLSHAAVSKWEKTADAATGMLWATEKDIRLLVLASSGTDPVEFVEVYNNLESIPAARRRAIQYDFGTVN